MTESLCHEIKMFIIENSHFQLIGGFAQID